MGAVFYWLRLTYRVGGIAVLSSKLWAMVKTVNGGSLIDTTLNHQCGAIPMEKASRLIRPPTLRIGIYSLVMCLISNIVLRD